MKFMLQNSRIPTKDHYQRQFQYQCGFDLFPFSFWLDQ